VPNNNKLKRKNLGSSNEALKTKKVKETRNKEKDDGKFCKFHD
jgi:hypothetical protein